MRYLLALAMAMVAPTIVTFRLEDPSGAPIKHELVIVQALDENEREVLRALTDENGNVSKLDLQPGLYRLIATSPYGLWETEVREFLVIKEIKKDLVLKVRPLPTHGTGDIVTVGTSWASLQVITSNGEPASGAKILVRDDKATKYLERWYTTDQKGRAKIEMTMETVVLVVIFDDILLTKELTDKDLTPVIRLPRN